MQKKAKPIGAVCSSRAQKDVSTAEVGRVAQNQELSQELGGKEKHETAGGDDNCVTHKTCSTQYDLMVDFRSLAMWNVECGCGVQFSYMHVGQDTNLDTTLTKVCTAERFRETVRKVGTYN